MRRFTIDSFLLGTSKHIVGDAEGYLLSDIVPRDTWHLTGNLKTAPSAKCLDTLHRLTGFQLSQPPEKYLVSMRYLTSGSQGVSIPWRYVLPQDEFRIFFKKVVQETTDTFNDLPFEYYESAWSPASRVLNSLRPAAVNGEVLQHHIDTLGKNAAGLESFRPKRSGFAQPAEYDRFATRTGRLTISSGPNMLILKKSCRDVLRSSFDNGSIVSLDFRALEARIVLAEAYKYSEQDDIYDEISQNQFKGSISRDIVKVAVLSDLYGISRGSLKARLGVSDQKLDSFIEVIRDYFRVESLRMRLKERVGLTGKMLNRFGRPLNVPEGQDNLLVNTYAQSSGVDVSMLGFDQVLKSLSTEGIRPIFVLHDAIILDVRADRLNDVKDIKDVIIPTYEKPFPLKFEHLTVH